MKLLASLLLLAPALAVPAPQDSGLADPPQESGSADTSCSDNTKDFKGWDLTSFSLRATTSRAAPIFAMRKSVSTLSFTVENAVLDYTVDCNATATTGADTAEASDSAGEFDGQYEFSCDAPDDEEQNGQILFSFDEESGKINMKQRWTCFEDPQFPTSYTGTGEGTAELDCESGEDEVNKDWKMDSEEDYSSNEKECAETEVFVELTQMDAIA